jgi:hypothetical protein
MPVEESSWCWDYDEGVLGETQEGILRIGRGERAERLLLFYYYAKCHLKGYQLTRHKILLMLFQAIPFHGFE